MPNDKFLSMLGICRKAARMCIGFGDTAEAVKLGKSILIYIASDLSQKTEKELLYITKDKPVEVIRTRYDMATLSHAVGIKTGVISINDRGFAEALTTKYQGEF